MNILVLTKLFSCLFFIAFLTYSPPLAEITSVQRDENKGKPSSELSQNDLDRRDSGNDAGALSKNLELLEQQYAQFQTNLEALKEESKRLHESAGVRLAALYKFRQIGYAAPLFSATKLEEVIEGNYLAEKLLSVDSRIFLDLYESGIKIREIEAALRESRQRIETIKSRLAAYESRRPVVGNGEVLSEVERQKDLYVKSPVELERNPSLLEKRLSSRKPIFDFNWTPFPSKKGELPLPTEGEIIETFSSKADASSRSILFNRGVIIKALRGQGIQAVHEGIVVFADWLKDYGNVMIIDHGNHYYTLTAHADKLLKKGGDIVRVGEMIATVGNTGSQEGSGLYFEIRHYGKPVDPTEWLAARKSFKE